MGEEDTTTHNESFYGQLENFYEERVLKIFAKVLEAILSNQKYWPYAGSVVWFVLLSAWGRRRFLLYGNVAVFLHGLAYIIFPSQSISFWSNGLLDPLHVELGRLTGIIVLTVAVCNYFLLQSTDKTVDAAMLVSHTVTAGLLCMNTMYTYNYPSKKKFAWFSQQTMDLGVFSSLGWFVICVLYTITQTDWGGFAELPSRRNLHLRLNFFALCVVGIVWFAFPSTIVQMFTNLTVKSLDGVHSHFIRLVGALLLGFCFTVAKSTNFLRETDKSAVLVSQMLGIFMALVSLVVCRSRFPGIFQCNGGLFRIALLCLLLFNSYLGVDFKAFYKQFCVSNRMFKNTFRVKEH
ncbi:hypothetical protein ScPMuIL_009830 [Solemya velum]